ncbi:LytR/AlgR family response regulator transcription factor [Bacteroidota bacterium]
MIITCIAVDDEPLALEKIESFIEKIHYLKLISSFDNAFDALYFLKNNDVQLMFLDIQMEDLTGIQLIESLTNPPMIIFTTAFEEYALKSYELEVQDYLLKPISFQRFLRATERIYSSFTKNQQECLPNTNNQLKAEDEYIFLKSGNKIQKVLFENILYIKGLKDYLIVKVGEERVVTHMNFSQMEELLPVENFIRVHKSYIVAINKINFIERNRIKIGEELIPISNTYKREFFNKINRNKRHTN